MGKKPTQAKALGDTKQMPLISEDGGKVRQRELPNSRSPTGMIQVEAMKEKSRNNGGQEQRWCLCDARGLTAVGAHAAPSANSL